MQPQVLLIDAGCEWKCYASDSTFNSLGCLRDVLGPHVYVYLVTRTMPVGNGGKFTPEAKAIYELVLDMQKENYLSHLPEPSQSDNYEIFS